MSEGLIGVDESSLYIWLYTMLIAAGFILDKQIATNSPKRIENAKILIANTCELLKASALLSLL